jgi:hypothetical protein
MQGAHYSASACISEIMPPKRASWSSKLVFTSDFQLPLPSMSVTLTLTVLM